MSVVISVNQKPLSITPSNGEHIWTLSSTSAQTLTDFKYLVDIYFRPSSMVLSASTPTARLKVRPNTYGKAIIELEEIVRTFLKANPRFSGTTYPFLNYVADENSVVTLSDAQQTITYNGYNLWPGGSPNANVPQLWHMEQYQVVLGCEYLSGSSIVTEFDYDASWQPDPINIFPGVDNKLIPEPFLSGATLGFGYNQSSNFFQIDNYSWYYYDLFRHIYRSGDDNDCQPRELLNAAGRIYETISQPDVVSRRVRRRLHHPNCPIIISFLDSYNEYFYNSTTGLVVRGALSHSDNYTYSAYTSNNSLLVNNYDLWKMGIFYLPYNLTASGLNQIPTNSKKLAFYLNGGVYCMRYLIDPTEPTNGDFEVDSWTNNPTFLTINGVDSSGVDNSAFWSGLTVGSIIVVQSQIGNIVWETTTVPSESSGQYTIYVERLDNNGIPFSPFYSQVCVQTTTSVDMNFSGRTSEILEFYMQEPDCINEPIHLLFLNGRGQWDTYTFGKKSTKTYEIERKTYRQESSLDKQFYSRGSYQRGTNVYESDATYRVECSSWYMDQNDTEIVEEIFLSPEVYMIEGTVIDPNHCNPPIDCQSCLEEIRLYQHLIPVVIRDTELKKYQKQYDKLFQYTFTLEYANVKRFRTQG
jgi:hypothetical protein